MRIRIITILSAVALLFCQCTKKSTAFSTLSYEVAFSKDPGILWEYKPFGSKNIVSFALPVLEINGEKVTFSLSEPIEDTPPVTLRNGVSEYVFKANVEGYTGLIFKVCFRAAQNSPVLRFRYELIGTENQKLTKSLPKDALDYFSVNISGFSTFKEIRFSEFNEMVHSFCLSERSIEKYHRDSSSFMGPMITGSNSEASFLIAYEHGSQVPDRFLEYSFKGDKEVTLKAVKGNYWNGFDLSQGYQTVWFETAVVKGTEENLASAFREFVLNYMSENTESRKPYIFYNTWNFQERNRNWYKKPYLADMTMERMLKEIEVAHKMGIEVFVIDAGWFEKTGDWNPSLKRFPDSLKRVKARLSEYGMKLGLWFNPTVASVSSEMYKQYGKYVRTRNGDKGLPWPIWETEESYGMCLVSPYKDAFADKLIQLNKELGVTYFKWDAIGQYECDDPNHFHGNSSNTPQERLENYAFEVGRAMSYVVDKLTRACPEAIVDFDITEGGRTVGLGFLSSGKYFLINNGPYFFNYDIPFDRENGQWNIFFYPGPARGWICRTPLTFDKWIPSSLFLTHYLPDDPAENQTIAVGSLILGQHGIWGDLPSISANGVEFFGKTLSMYKQIREDMTSVAMTRDGAVGGSPEIYEKVNPSSGKGAVVIFSSHAGKYEYISKNKVNKEHWETDNTTVALGPDGRAKITVVFKNAEAKIIFFGVKN